MYELGGNPPLYTSRLGVVSTILVGFVKLRDEVLVLYAFVCIYCITTSTHKVCVCGSTQTQEFVFVCGDIVCIFVFVIEVVLCLIV